MGLIPRSGGIFGGSLSVLVYLVVFVALYAGFAQAQLTQAQINQFVSEHNTYRAGVSPTAANMQQIVSPRFSALPSPELILKSP